MKNLIYTLIAHIWYSLLLYADSRPSISEKTIITAKLIFISAPIGYVLKQFDKWFTTNHEFVSFVLYAVAFNIVVGIYYHWKKKTFSWKDFLVKNIEMFVILILVYFLLEMINQVAGLSITGEYFQMLIQVITLLYPISKALKNIHILSNYKHPPHFIMNRIYKFEQDGDLTELLKKEHDETFKN